MKADLGALAKWRKLCAGAFVLAASSLIILGMPSFNFPDPVVDTGLDTNGIFSGVDVTSIEKPLALVKPVSDQWPTMWAHPAVKTYTFSEWAPTGSPLIVEEAKALAAYAAIQAATAVDEAQNASALAQSQQLVDSASQRVLKDKLDLLEYN